jgi:hypothetical protein
MPSLNTKLATAPNVSANYVLKATTSTTIGNSLIFDNGNSVLVNLASITGYGTPKFVVKQSTANDYEGIIALSSSNDNSVTISHTGTIGRIASTYGSTGSYTSLAFATSQIDRLTITSTGNVGISTSTPSARLDVRVPVESPATGAVALIAGTSNGANDIFRWYDGTTQLGVFKNNGRVGIGSTSPGDRLVVVAAANEWAGVFVGNNTTNQSFGVQVFGGTNSADTAFRVLNGAQTTEYFKVRGDGYLFSTPTYNNTWAGFSANMYIASDGSFGRTTPSSGRYKDNINDWNGKGLETILALKPKTFKYKKDYCETADIDFLGLIAEEVAEVSPYLAQYEKADRTGLVENVRYDIIVVPLIAAIQELKAEVDTLKQLVK